MDRKWSCANCGKAFLSGEWYNCRDNKTRKHIVESKTYYSQSDREVFNAIPSSTMLGSQNERITIPGKIVEFTGGVYHTTDPEIQELMDEQYTMTKEQYVDLRTTTEMKNGRLRQKLEEQAVLIDQLKAQVADKKAPKEIITQKELAAAAEIPEDDEEIEGALVGAAKAKAGAVKAAKAGAGRRKA